MMVKRLHPLVKSFSVLFLQQEKKDSSIACISLAPTRRDINNLVFGLVSVEGLLILKWQGFLIPLLQLSWSPSTPLPFLSWVKYAACWILLLPISAFANVSVCHRFSCWLRWIPSMPHTPLTFAIFIKVGRRCSSSTWKRDPSRKEKSRMAVESSN